VTVDLATRRTWASRVIDASPEEIFAVLTDASLHSVIDGSGSVKSSRGASEPLRMGSKFGMNMRLGVPYTITNTVVEYEPNRVIAWRHVGRHRWRYELEPVDGGTKVTETFDWSTALVPKAIELVGYPARHEPGIEATLERLDAYVTNRRPST
jgi:uncharacterized protein YndB with AHSA1/START domain